MISQGSVESVLGAKPAERRSLVEEAAGLGRFKLRRHRAELKLARVATQVERARDLEDEVRKRLRPLALQATAAERAAKLGEEIARLQAAIATLDLAALDRAPRRRRGCAACAELRAPARARGRSSSSCSPRGRRAEEELTDAAGAREAATAALYRLRAGARAARRCGARRRRRCTAALAADHEAARGYDPARSDELAARARRPRPRRRRPRASARGSSSTPRSAGRAVAALERAGQAAIAGALEQLARERAVVEAELVGGGRNALLALRDAAAAPRPAAGVAARLATTLRRELAEAASLRDDRSGARRARRRRRRGGRRRPCRRARARRPRGARRACGRAARGARTARSPSAKGFRRRPARSPSAASGSRSRCSTCAPGEERAVAAALGRLASAIVARRPRHALALLEHARSGGLGSLVVLVGRDPRALVESLPVVEREVLLDSPSPP